MLDTNIYTTRFSASNSTYNQVDGTLLLEDIIEDISDLTFKDVVTKIRNVFSNSSLTEEEQKTQSTKIKVRELPMFWACVQLDQFKTLDKNDSWEATGIIQFDIDGVTEEKALELKAIISSYSDCIYAFISPRYGLKFGIYTDFKATSTHEFRTAYAVAKQVIQERVSVELDDSMANISQSCFVSYDPEAFFNLDVTQLQIEKSVLTKILAENTEKKQQRLINENISLTTTYSDTSSDEIIRALSYIGKDLRYHERVIINYAVIDGLGVHEAKLALMEHWAKSDKNKLEKQIDSLCKSFKKGGGIHVATLFQMANKNKEYHKRGRRNPVIDTEEEATFNNKRYSVSEASEKLEKSIHSFFIDKQSKIINFEAGAGKTTQFREMIYNEIITGEMRSRVSIFVRSHETAEEYLEHFNKLSRENDHPVSFMDKMNSRSDKHKLIGKVQHIKGRYQLDKSTGKIDKNSHCKHELLMTGDVDDKVIFDKHAPKFCLSCKFRENCGYVEQFNPSTMYEHQVRIYTHQALFNQSSLWDGGSFYEEESDQFAVNKETYEAHYLIVDEDILGQVFDSNQNEINRYSWSCESVQNIIHSVKNGNKTVEEAIIEHRTLVISDYEEQKENVRFINEESKKIDYDGTLDEIRKSARNQKSVDFNYHRILKEMVNFLELYDIDNSPLLKHNGIHFNEKSGELYLFKMKRIQQRFIDQPMMILDASADENLWRVVSEKLLDKTIEFENIRVEYSPKVKVFQYGDKSYSRYYFQQKKTGADNTSKLIELIKISSKGKKIGLITYKNLEGTDNFYEYLAQELGIEKGCYSYFGNVRGLNAMDDAKIDQLYIVGRHSIGQGVDNQYRQLFSDITKSEIDQSFTRADKEEVFRMKSGDNKSIRRDHYHDEVLVSLDNHFNKGETYQAGHRLRLIHSDRDKELILLTNEVLDFTIDDLIVNGGKEVKVADEIILKMEEVILTDGFILAKNIKIAEVTGFSIQAIADNKKKITEHFQDRTTTEMGGYRQQTKIIKYI